MKKNCVLFLCQEINTEYIYRFNKLKNSIPDNYDIYWICNEPINDTSIMFFKTKTNDELINEYGKVKYGWESYEELNDILLYGKGGFHYQCILQYLDFYKIHTEYEFYWCIEYDVYMHDFKYLFSKTDNDNSDLIASNIIYQNNNTDEGWLSWNRIFCRNMNNPYFDEVSSNNNIKALFTVFRLSNNFFNIIQQFYKNKYYTFFEYGILLLGKKHNMNIKDLLDFDLIEDRSQNENNKIHNDALSNSWTQRYLEKYFPDIFDKESHIIKYKTNILYHPVKLDYKFEDSDNYYNKKGEH